MGHTARRNARHRELHFLLESNGGLPFDAISLRLRYDLIPQKRDHLAGNDIFR